MSRSCILIVLLALLLSTACRHELREAPSTQPEARPSVVEERWPDGTLRLRKQVLVQQDGPAVDHGNFERWHSNGNKEYEAVFVHGKKEGTTLRYHANGQMATRQEYRDGLRHGASTSWDANGVQVKQEHWAEGKPHGVWTIWKSGEVRWTQVFDHGIPVTPKGQG